MNITEESNFPLEILIATMNRTSLDFLDNTFRNADISKCQILIINQTTPEVLLDSNDPNIRVINSFEKGLSKSRNLALENAKADVVLIADDDVVFEREFHKTILTAFKDYNEAALITFKVWKENNEEYRDYPTKHRWHTIHSLENIMSIEIALNRKIILGTNLKFNALFGLGSHFETAEEYIFCRDALSKGLRAFFYDAFIVSHSEFNSGQGAGNDRIIYARAAMQYKLYKQLAYFWLLKYLFFLIRHNYIQLSDVKHKWSLGIKGIKDYQVVTNKLDT